MKTLKLFNAVIRRESSQSFYLSEHGFIIESGALWAKQEIIDFYKNEKLDGYGLNKTFHKSWKTILNNSRFDLWMDQIRHYVSTYGSNFEGEIYIPDEIIEIPDSKIVFKVVKAFSKDELTQKCLQLLQSGIALKEETINDVLSILVDELYYQFTGNENIKNKEAVIKIADIYGVIPKDTLEFFRYILYRTTGESLLIKSKKVINAIQVSNYNPAVQFEQFGLTRLAAIFNRFKPLFLAFKTKCPKTINKISKLSKTHHQPLVANPLNYVTSIILTKEDLHWLDNATPFALFRAISACYTRMEGQFTFTYRIRNGKSFVKSDMVSGANWDNYDILIHYCKEKFNLKGKKFFLPEDVEYALPTSEKMFVGNFPTGSKFYGNQLAVGIYWENQWGAHDLDLSGLNLEGKVGWNSAYKQGDGALLYSGDMTNAPGGAVEYLYAKDGLSAPTLVLNNVFRGDVNCDYKIIVGKGDQVDYYFMMNPNHLFVEAKCQSVQRQSILGMLIPEEGKQAFVILNFGAGASRVSGNSDVALMATDALYQQWSNPLTLRTMLLAFGGEIVTEVENADYNLSLNNLQKDSFINIFKR
jgi:hypothetical protein